VSISVYMVPQSNKWPDRGGVREHLRQLYCHLDAHPQVELITSSNSELDIMHVESAYTSPWPPNVYVCHGGFVPDPIHSVVRNLGMTQVIVSVARWLMYSYFPNLTYKTIVIPNGVNLDEWNDISPSGLEPGYILYAKEWAYHINDFVSLAWSMPQERVVSTVKPKGMSVPGNLEVIGLQDRDAMRSVLNDAKCLVFTGKEVCPTMLLEAWACGVPVMGRYGGGVSELMFDHKRGALVGGCLYQSLEECAKLIHSLDREAVGAAGREWVEHHYQWRHLVDRYVELYEAIMQDEVTDYVAAWHARNGGRATA